MDREKMKLEKPLDSTELRVLGSLLEKQQTTPDYYPMTVNGIVAASNQKSNRDPVMELTETEVQDALDRLQHQVLVWKVIGSRTIHWKHNVDGPWDLDAAGKAVITLLILRGPQTPGELRGRSERLFAFRAPSEVEDILRKLASGEEPLVVEMPRQPGRKERRWMHLIGGTPDFESVDEARAPVASTRSAGLEPRVAQLEETVERLMAEIRDLKAQLGV